jgi:hypothetical protein
MKASISFVGDNNRTEAILLYTKQRQMSSVADNYLNLNELSVLAKTDLDLDLLFPIFGDILYLDLPVITKNIVDVLSTMRDLCVDTQQGDHFFFS